MKHFMIQPQIANSLYFVRGWNFSDPVYIKGVYEYLLTRNEKHLNIRAFTDSQKRTLYERQGGICPTCPKPQKFEINQMEADHIKPWSQGGKTELDNGQMLCRDCNRAKSNK